LIYFVNVSLEDLIIENAFTQISAIGHEEQYIYAVITFYV